MSDPLFDTLQSEMSSAGAVPTLDRLIEQLRKEEKYHELFDARLMQSRHRMGLPADAASNLEDLPEAMRNQVEEVYLEACREVGGLLLAAGKFRESWIYLRAAGEKQSVMKALAAVEATDSNIEELVDIALHQGVTPTLGLQLVLNHYGTCNAITTYDGVMRGQPICEQQAGAELLVRHLHEELLTNVRGHIERQEKQQPRENTLRDLISHRDWLFENGTYHIDTSHLSSVVRFARLIERPDPLHLAWDLTEYGRRLNAQLQYPGEEPFEEIYPSHALLFAASLGEQVDEAVKFFGDRAQLVSIEQEGIAAVETYLILLARLGRPSDALEAWANLVPPGASLSPYGPTMLDLARKTHCFDRFLEICRQRDDRLAFMAGLLEAATLRKST